MSRARKLSWFKRAAAFGLGSLIMMGGCSTPPTANIHSISEKSTPELEGSLGRALAAQSPTKLAEYRAANAPQWVYVEAIRDELIRRHTGSDTPWPEDDDLAIRRGVIQEGMSWQMVRAALGPPNAIRSESEMGMTLDMWEYRNILEPGVARIVVHRGRVYDVQLPGGDQP